MSDALAKYNPDLTQPQPGELPRVEDLRLLSINEARSLLGVRYETVKLLIDDGRIEVIIIGKRIRIPAISLKKFIEENTVKLNETDAPVKSVNSMDFVENKINSIIHKHKRSK